MAKKGIKKHFFVPGEIIVMVEHSNNTSASEAIFNFLSELDVAAQEQGLKLPLLADSKMAFEPRQFFYDKTDNSPGLSTVKLILTGDIEDEEGQTKSVIDWMNFFSVYYDKERQKIANVITPNWFSIPAPAPTMDGGPDGKPEPPQNPKWIPFEGTIIDDIGKVDETCKVNVFVLDTIPDMSRLNWAKDNLNGHEIWQRINKQCVSKQLIHMSNSLQTVGGDVTGPKHDYEMPDHGLFIAGTVAMLAPNAEIHLVEVLNKFGVGTLESVLEGLAYVIEQKEKNHDRKIVVNCSFMLSVPLTERQFHGETFDTVQAFLAKGTIHGPEYNLDDNKVKGKDNYKKFVPKTGLEQWLLRPIVEVLNILYQKFDELLSEENILEVVDSSGVMIFAAAGNSGGNGIHPPAMYPAAYQPVFGVGALDKNKSNQMTDYSNIADSPLTDGFLTFGGLSGKKGMLGLYIHDTFPPSGVANNNGWAIWSGTSFATGVMSGLAVALLCNTAPSAVLAKLYGLSDMGSGAPHEVDVAQATLGP